MYPIFLWNSTNEDIEFMDIGLYLPSHEFFQLNDDEHVETLYRENNELWTSIKQEKVFFVKTDVNNPPLEDDFILSEEVEEDVTNVEIIDAGTSDSIFYVEQEIEGGKADTLYNYALNIDGNF